MQLDGWVDEPRHEWGQVRVEQVEGMLECELGLGERSVSRTLWRSISEGVSMSDEAGLLDKLHVLDHQLVQVAR